MHACMHCYCVLGCAKYQLKRYVIYVTRAGGICLICMHEPEGKCGHIRQIPTAHVTYYYVTLLALQKSAKFAIHCTASM